MLPFTRVNFAHTIFTFGVLMYLKCIHIYLELLNLVKVEFTGIKDAVLGNASIR